ncbi:glutamine synthetase family protein [Pseudoteredinibacter isoporae]|uniref:Glutamine synthetase n=1 Tax=Pseudoteredinibacter isoporae TaxID=570281 RepID=A0A7X0JS32_9GAMM|nr:glutamine synthetase family protein [Pseudoteredinibacter isoporae]MBB6521122.1 glutamine synthetase [Pseudoteredinibacter isoporae]NHO86683.1 glutamine synthetase [Pseudoteredinibacter isoporae]NIB24865.1 glutamine synthetase [Pseudoteredinibacter isoporae]
MSKTAEHQHLVMVAWNDLTGISRVRGVPSSRLESLKAKGLGWACAGHALLPNGDIADNPWGPMDEVQQVPDVDTEVYLDADEQWPAYHLFLANTQTPDGKPWQCCPRVLCKQALNDFKSETGAEFITAFEHEFTLISNESKGSAFTLDATRQGSVFLESLVNQVCNAGVTVETYEAEFGENQYEISCAPKQGIHGVDQALIAREVIRETARRQNMRASFTPKPSPSAPGNGMHFHFSFVDGGGQPLSFDRHAPGQLSELAAQFVAGIHVHMPALMAFAASTPLSYERIGPGHWSCGYACVGVQNREAALRIIPVPGTSSGASHNIEFRPPDGAGNPYLFVAALIYAGLDGVRSKLELPPLLECDPHSLSAEEQEKMGVRLLPGSLGEALDALKNDRVLCDALPDQLFEVFMAIKNAEIKQVKNISLEELYSSYGHIY